MLRICPLPHPNPKNDLSGNGSGHVGDFLTALGHVRELSPHQSSSGTIDLVGVAPEVLRELQGPDPLLCRLTFFALSGRVR